MTAIQGTADVVLEGRGPLQLRPSDYVATGGEGSVYRKSSIIIKLYTDTAKMVRDGMPDKIRLLSRIKSPFVVAPSGVVTDSNGKPIGYYMPFAEGEPLSRVFTTAFWQRESFGVDDAVKLVDRMRDTVRAAHDHQAVMVDANELNWIVASLKGRDGPEPRAIDVDSWAIGKWRATVIMPSIRDWHAKAFDARSDWFAYGVVSFQVLTGIHPYRGTLAGYKPSDLEGRMKANASVFAKGIGLNRAVRDFGKIPAPLLDWYIATFEKGERSIPPSPYDTAGKRVAQAAMIHRTVTTHTGSLAFDKLFEVTGESVVRVYPCGTALTNIGCLYEIRTKRDICIGLTAAAEVMQTPDGWLIGEMASSGIPGFTFVDSRTYKHTTVPFALSGLRLFRSDNRLYLVTENELVELQVMMVGDKPMVMIGKRTQILRPNATQWFDGVGVQKAFGATFLVLPFGESACATVRVRELDTLTPITAVAGNRFVTVIGIDKTGAYKRVDLTLTANYAGYTPQIEDVDSPDLNVTLLPKGVGAKIPEDGELAIFVPTNGQEKRVQDRHIATDMALTRIGDTVAYVKDGAVWSVKLT